MQGEHLGALIGRRGETMESLSYLASLVVNRMDGPYVKLGIDVGGYRGKREGDLYALARRIAERVQRTGCCYEMEPMNPYERHIIHTAISAIEACAARARAKATTAASSSIRPTPTPATCPTGRAPAAAAAPRRDGRGPRRDDRRGRGNGRGNGRREGGRGPRGYGKGPRPSSVPAREFADAPRDPEAKPQAPATTHRIHDDGDDFAMFGKIEL